MVKSKLYRIGPLYSNYKYIYHRHAYIQAEVKLNLPDTANINMDTQ